MGNLAVIYNLQGRFSLAEQFHKQVLELRKKILGENHPDTLTSMNNLAVVYNSQGKYLLSEPLYKKTFALAKKIFGDNNHKTLISMSNIASHYQKTKNWLQAEKIWQEHLHLSNQSLEKLLWRLSEKTRQSYILQQKGLRNNYLSFYSFRNPPKEALYYSLSRKGLLLRIASEINTLSKKSTDLDLKIDVEKLISLKNQLSAQAMLAFSGKIKKNNR